MASPVLDPALRAASLAVDRFMERLGPAHIVLLLIPLLIWLLRQQPRRSGPELVGWFIIVFAVIGVMVGALARALGISPPR